MNSKGQMLIEALSVGVLYWLALFAVMGFILFVWSQLWTEHHLYENLICLNSPTNKAQCEKRFLNQTQKGLLLFKVKNLKWNTEKTHIQIELLGPLGFQKTVQKHLPKVDL